MSPLESFGQIPFGLNTARHGKIKKHLKDAVR